MLYSEPPPYRFFGEDKPTLLVCWWCTIFACVIIIFRVCGRYVRSEELFTEDKIAFWSVIPILTRQALVHVVILFGTNNMEFGGIRLSDHEIWRREVGSRLVILSRIFYAASLWMLKFAIMFYLKRITDNIYKNSYTLLVKLAFWYFALTFVASVISSLTECQPFNDYWQVQPTPEGSCRQGFVQLITTAVANVTSDLILVILPLPIVWSSKLGRAKQIQISLLFCLSVVPIGISLYRVPAIIHSRGAQAQRSLWASIEILFATSAANALVLGTFMRDRGTKKNKYKFGSDETVERRRSTIRTRETNLHKRWGSDEDLVRDLGLSVSRGMWEEDLTDDSLLPQQPPPTAKPVSKGSGPYMNGGYVHAASSKSVSSKQSRSSGVNKHWRFPARQPASRSHGDNISEETESIIASASQTGLSSPNPRSPVLSAHDVESPPSGRHSHHQGTKSKLTFFDVGNLLRADDARSHSHQTSDPSQPNQIQVQHQQQSSHQRRKSSVNGFGTTTTITAGSSSHPGHPGHLYSGSHSTNNSRSNTQFSPTLNGLSPAPHPGMTRSTTSPPFSYSAAFEPGDVLAPRKGSAVFLADVGGLLEGGAPISVSAAESNVISPFSLNDPLGSKNAEAAAKEVLGYWDREKPSGPAEEVEMQNLESPGPSPSDMSGHSPRPGIGVMQRSTSRKGKGIGHSASKSGFSFVSHSIPHGLGRGRGERAKETASPIMPPQLRGGRADGDEASAMQFTDVGGLLRR